MRKKLLKFYKNNRIYCILMLISISCFILIGATLIGIMFQQMNGNSEYGTRLDGIKKYPLDKNIKDMNKYLKDSEDVSDSSIKTQGKIIYINVDVKDDANKEQVQNIGNSLLEFISAENKGYYDIQFIFNRKSYDSYLGSKSSSSDVITWNYTFDTEPNNASSKE